MRRRRSASRSGTSIALTIPRHTTVSGSATLVDPVPAGLTYVPGSAAANLDGTALPTAGLTLSFDPTGNGTVKVQAPPVYTNNTNADQILTVSFSAIVADSYPQNARPATITNTATLTYTDSLGNPQVRTSSADTAIVEPNLHLSQERERRQRHRRPRPDRPLHAVRDQPVRPAGAGLLRL